MRPTLSIVPRASRTVCPFAAAMRPGFRDSAWTITLYGNNVGDRRGIVGADPINNISQTQADPFYVTYIRPRTESDWITAHPIIASAITLQLAIHSRSIPRRPMLGSVVFGGPQVEDAEILQVKPV